jgi:phage terminase large subunit
MYQQTTALKKVLALRKRIRAVAGGTGASKTVSILQWHIDYAQSHLGEVMDVVSESFPHLEGGVIREFKAIMLAHGYWDDARWNETKHIYTFETGTTLNFKSIDKLGKAHGPRRDVLFVNECNNVSWPIVDQLITRTRKIVWLDWNPTTIFWFYDYGDGTGLGLRHRADVDFITLTFLDNEALDDGQKQEILSHRNNKAWWRVYGEGQLGELEGKIFKDWLIIDELPHAARLVSNGLDFGYTNDPTANDAI